MELTGNDEKGKEVLISYSSNGGLLVEKIKENRNELNKRFLASNSQKKWS